MNSFRTSSKSFRRCWNSTTATFLPTIVPSYLSSTSPLPRRKRAPFLLLFASYTPSLHGIPCKCHRPASSPLFWPSCNRNSFHRVSTMRGASRLELLQIVIRYIPNATLKLLIKGVVAMLPTRLRAARTDAYVYVLVYFFVFIMAWISQSALWRRYSLSESGSVLNATSYLSRLPCRNRIWLQLLLANVVLPQIP